MSKVVGRIKSVAGLVAELTDDPDDPIRQTDKSFGLHILDYEVPPPFNLTPQMVAADKAIRFLKVQGIEAELEILDQEFFTEDDGEYNR